MSIYRSDPAAPGANIRRRQIDSSGVRLEQAVEFFNRSQAGRTVAGLSRSLGEPRVSVGAAAGSPTQVRVTVAWELCWYQWAVDLGDGRGSVCQIARGEEVGQLDRPARQWNAAVGEGSQVVFGVAGGPPPGRLPWLRRR